MLYLLWDIVYVIDTLLDQRYDGYWYTMDIGIPPKSEKIYF